MYCNEIVHQELVDQDYLFVLRSRITKTASEAYFML